MENQDQMYFVEVLKLNRIQNPPTQLKKPEKKEAEIALKQGCIPLFKGVFPSIRDWSNEYITISK